MTSRTPHRLGVLGRKSGARRREADKMPPHLAENEISEKLTKRRVRKAGNFSDVGALRAIAARQAECADLS